MMLFGMDQEFPDLLRKNGNGSTPRKLQSRSNEAKQDQKPDILNSGSNHPSAVMEDEISSLFQYPPYYEYLEKEFGCDFLCEFPNPHAITTDKQNKSINNEGSSTASFNLSAQQYAEFPQKKVYKEGGESSSMRTAISCLSQRNNKKELEASFPSEMAQNETFEATGTSSSGGSGVSFRAAPKEVKNQCYKRKGREVEESCSLSEEGDYESPDGKKPAQRSRRSRAAEVHNLSERKRRDRINEKMKALQDLIPHCTKSDKASMLDEAIEYLKSLQQQVQIMWMGSSMATMMFPTVPNLMAHMSMGIGRAPMPALSDLLQLQRVPLINQVMPSAMPANPVAVCPKFPLQMPESLTPHIGFHHLQASPQAMSLYGYGSQMAQQNQLAAVSRSSSLPKTDESAPESPRNGK